MQMRCTTYGLNLGYAFQIADDVLDYASDARHAGQEPRRRPRRRQGDAAADPCDPAQRCGDARRVARGDRTRRHRRAAAGAGGDPCHRRPGLQPRSARANMPPRPSGARRHVDDNAALSRAARAGALRGQPRALSRACVTALVCYPLGGKPLAKKSSHHREGALSPRVRCRGSPAACSRSRQREAMHRAAEVHELPVDAGCVHFLLERRRCPRASCPVSSAPLSTSRLALTAPRLRRQSTSTARRGR